MQSPHSYPSSYWLQKGILKNIYIFLLMYSWLTIFQVQSKVIQLYKYTFIIFKIIFHHRLL